MAAKRARFSSEVESDDDNLEELLNVPNKKKMATGSNKHTLDSDEEDSDDYEKDDLRNSDIEGEEEGSTSVQQDEIKITPFNMREELQEGHFDRDGHYHWNKEVEIKDNWMDNIEWSKIKNVDQGKRVDADDETEENSNGLPEAFNEIAVYKSLLEFMEPNEKVNQTLQRLGKGRAKLSSVERLRQKKLGVVDEAAIKITNFTELANKILTKTGNMDIYQTTYRQIQEKINSQPGTSQAKGSTSCIQHEEFDMYADDFNEKEQKHLDTAKKLMMDDNKASKESRAGKEGDEKEEENDDEQPEELMWELKWKQEDNKIEGPYDTKQMLKWSQEGRFKDGVYVRKIGESKNFYSSHRIDFDLYL